MNPLLGGSNLQELHGKRCFVSWSGGKDGCLALYRAVRAGARVDVLVNMMVEGGQRSRSHGLRRSVIEAQASAMGFRLAGAATSWSEYEEHFIGILGTLKEEGIEAGIFGDIDLQAHLEWERMACRHAGMIPVLPLWQEERMTLVREFCEAGFETRIVAVRANALSPDHLGRRFTPALAEEFAGRGVDACGENGEFHTVVTNGPLFLNPIRVVSGKHVLRDGCWFLDFKVIGEEDQLDLVPP
jgi:uncharacterized protein (TIGR00290 family)